MSEFENTLDRLRRCSIPTLATLGLAATNLVGCSANTPGARIAEEIKQGPIVILAGAVRNPDGDTAIRPVAVDVDTGSASCPEDQVGKQMNGEFRLYVSGKDHRNTIEFSTDPDATLVSRTGKVAFHCISIDRDGMVIGPNGLPYTLNFGSGPVTFATRQQTGSAQAALNQLG